MTMELLKELFGMIEEAKTKKKKKTVARTAAAAVYHRDYEKTKHKPYREYDPDERKDQADD
jgi:hypothetical protein